MVEQSGHVLWGIPCVFTAGPSPHLGTPPNDGLFAQKDPGSSMPLDSAFFCFFLLVYLLSPQFQWLFKNRTAESAERTLCPGAFPLSVDVLTYRRDNQLWELVQRWLWSRTVYLQGPPSHRHCCYYIIIVVSLFGLGGPVAIFSSVATWNHNSRGAWCTSLLPIHPVRNVQVALLLILLVLQAPSCLSFNRTKSENAASLWYPKLRWELTLHHSSLQSMSKSL